jgi:hypothetical protein
MKLLKKWGSILLLPHNPQGFYDCSGMLACNDKRPANKAKCNYPTF